MALIVDSGALYAWYDRDDDWHERVVALFRSEHGALVVPSPVIPEVDHLLGRTIGIDAQLALYEDLAAPAYVVAELDPGGYARVHELNHRYRDLRLGFVDVAVMAVAEQLGIGRIATTDRRDFAAMTLDAPIELLPD